MFEIKIYKNILIIKKIEFGHFLVHNGLNQIILHTEHQK